MNRMAKQIPTRVRSYHGRRIRNLGAVQSAMKEWAARFLELDVKWVTSS